MTPTSTTPGPEDLALSSGNSAVMAWKFGPARLEIQARGTEIWALNPEIPTRATRAGAPWTPRADPLRIARQISTPTAHTYPRNDHVAWA